MACNIKDFYDTFEKINFETISINSSGVISFFYNKLNDDGDYIDGEVILIPKNKTVISGGNIDYLVSMSLLCNFDNNTHNLKTYITSSISIIAGTLLDQETIFKQIYNNKSPLKSYANQTFLNDGECFNVEPSTQICTQYKEDIFYVYLYPNFKPIL